MKEVPLIDVFDTTDFNPELILSSVLSDPTLDFVTNADELNDNIMIPDMLQHLGNPVFFSQNIICMNNNNNDNLDGSNQQLVQNLPNNQQQNQHLHRMAAHQTSNFKATRVHTAAEKFTDKEMESFEVELTRQISSSLLVAKGAQTAQQQSPAIGQQQQQQQQNCKCEFCEYLQANRISLTGDHSFQCEFCGEGFSNQTSFNQHRCGITDIHLFRCENCHRDYNSSRVSYSFGNAEQRNKCDLCDQSNGQTHSEGPTLYSSPQITVNATAKVKNSPPSEAIKSNTRTEDTFPMLPIVDGPIVSTPFLSPVIPSHHVSTGILSEHNAGSPQCTDNNSSSQHVEIGVGTFVSDSKRIGDFLKRVEDNFNEFITTPTIVSKTNRNNNISLTTSSGNHVQHLTESSKTYFVLENSDQIQQFQHNRTFNNSGTSSINSTANNFRHIISTPIPNQHHPAQTRPLYPGEHGVTSLQQYDQYDDEDYSSMSEDEAIVPREPYAESPNQENAKTELPIQETVVDTSSSLLQFESVENGLSIKKNVSLEEISKKADSQKNLNQDHPQFEEQQHKISSIRCTDNNESGKCDSSSSFEKCSIVDECVKMQLDSPVQSVCNSTIDRPYKCNICERSYRNQKNLKSHLKVHEGIRAYQCEICGKNFSGSSYLVIHRRRHTGERPFKCTTCGKAFVDSRALSVHTRLHSGERLKCEKCEKTFSSVSALTVHNRLHTGIHPYKCDLCDKTFPQYNNLKHHMKKHDASELPLEKQSPRICGNKISNTVYASTIGMPHHPVVSKKITPNLSATVQIVASSNITSIFEHKCHICSKLHKSTDDLQEHLNQHNKERPNQCEFCSKVFPRSSHLIIHRRRHTGERPFKCKYCDKAFVDSRALSVHTRLHTGERVKCEICEKTFASSSGLIVHRRIHTGVHPYKCEYCEKSFAQSTALKYHLKKHETVMLPTTTSNSTGGSLIHALQSTDRLAVVSKYQFSGSNNSAEAGDRHKCLVCNKLFRSSEYLVRHRRTHSGERPYQCETCGKHFSTMSYLVIHRRRHTSEKPYKCNTCEKAFVDSRALQEHVRLHTGDRVRCEICQKTYSSVSNLIVHRRIHSGIHPFECESCGKSFAQKNALKYHLKKHTKHE